MWHVKGALNPQSILVGKFQSPQYLEPEQFSQRSFYIRGFVIVGLYISLLQEQETHLQCDVRELVGAFVFLHKNHKKPSQLVLVQEWLTFLLQEWFYLFLLKERKKTTCYFTNNYFVSFYLSYCITVKIIPKLVLQVIKERFRLFIYFQCRNVKSTNSPFLSIVYNHVWIP